MDFQQAWKSAVSNTEIIRSRISALQTFSDTKVPYILLSESTVNLGDTVVRKGEVLVQKPSLILPPNVPQFEGFDFEDLGQGFNEDSFMNFLLIRGVQMPSMKYNNATYSLDLFEGRLAQAVKHYQQELQQKENVTTGLLVGPEDLWQFSLLIFMCSQISRNAQTDIRRLLKDHDEKFKGFNQN